MDPSNSTKMTSPAVQLLFSYVADGNLAALKEHLETPVDVDSRGDNGETPLMVAAEQGSVDIVRELIRRGADVHLDDLECSAPLTFAVKGGEVEVVRELLENKADLEHRDAEGWTPLVWATYIGRPAVARLLLERGANPNITCSYSVYPIIWAAGRGHADVLRLLLQHGAKVNCSDKYGTTPLIWAARKGHYDCIVHLLDGEADVNQKGVDSLTALIVAAEGGFTRVVKELLKRSPNVNMTDRDGYSALAIAAKEGHVEIVQDLLDAGSYVNIPDRNGETMLIGAVREGHVEIVRALLNKYVDIDIKGPDGKTALFWAVEKGNATMVRDILERNPDTESCTKDGETPLIRAARKRSPELVELLLDNGAKVSCADRKGDTPLHIAMRGRCRNVAELLLRNPQNGRVLYHPNKAGETPYCIDCTHQKSILTQIFGARHLSPFESGGYMSGHGLYSSALADILSEPTMQPPICVGLYAQWGGGKSVLLKKLEREMKMYAGQQIEPLFQFSWLVLVLTLVLCGATVFLLGLVIDYRLAIAVALILLTLICIFFDLVYVGSRQESDSWNWMWSVSTYLARQVDYLELLFRLVFVNPPEFPEPAMDALPVRFLFTEYCRLSSFGGEASLAEMIAALSDACEREFGVLAARLFRVFKSDEFQGNTWKKSCGIPAVLLFFLTASCLIANFVLLAVFRKDRQNPAVSTVLKATSGAVGLILLLHYRTWWRLADSVLNSQRKRLHVAAKDLHKLKTEGFMMVLMQEMELMSDMARAVDGFTQNQTRMVVVMDGLESCEQYRVLQMLDMMRVLFSKRPFISIFACDPHIIDRICRSALRDTNINGHTYMRNIVHLPVFLDGQALGTTKNPCAATPSCVRAMSVEGRQDDGHNWRSQNGPAQDQARLGSRVSIGRRSSCRLRKMQRARQMSFDLTRILVTEDWFSDISPQTMRRLLNIISFTGRLLRANNVVFDWDRLSSWIHLTEEWPYRMSWIILFVEKTESASDELTLKNIYDRICKSIPGDAEPLLEVDADVRRLEVFLASRKPVLTARDVDRFLPCTVNLDPKFREIISTGRAAKEQAHMEGATYPAPVRPQVGFRYASPCAQTGTFPLQNPRSAYFNRLPGPQHPVYNRPPFPKHVCPPQRQCPNSNAPPIPVVKQPAQPRGARLPPPAAPLSSMSTDGVCERLGAIEGMDPDMLPRYIAAVRRANISGRVLARCSLDELRGEMEMNFGDWQLFSGMVTEQRRAESQALLDNETRSAVGL